MKHDTEAEAHARELIADLTSPDPDVREEAAMWLGAIAGAPEETEADLGIAAILAAEAVAPLTRALEDTAPGVRDAAREALDAIRGDAGGIAPALEGEGLTEPSKVRVDARELPAEIREKIAAQLKRSPADLQKDEDTAGGRPDRVMISLTGEPQLEVDTTLLEPGQDLIEVFVFHLPWMGESTIDYDFQDGLLLVSGKTVGADLTKGVIQHLPSRHEIVSVVTDAAHFVDLPSLPNLRAVSALLGVDDEDLSHVQELTGLTALHLGGLVRFDIDIRPDARITDAGLARLRGLGDLRDLNLTGTHITDAGLAHLGDLARLRTLCLNSTGITGEGLRHLEHLPDLQSLWLGGNQVNENGLGHLERLARLRVLGLHGLKVDEAAFSALGGLSALRELHLYESNLTDGGLAHLARLEELRKLQLGNTQITDEGLVHLGGMTNLLELGLTGTRVTDSGLANLRRLTHLRELGLGKTGISDAGLAHLENLRDLETLQLWETRITDEGLLSLQGLKKLRRLELAGTELSEEALNQLGLALPDCDISHSEPDDSGTEDESGCFIATAAFGSPLAHEVEALRDFRDRVLAKSVLGRMLISLYEHTSPPIAKAVSRNPAVKGAVRRMLRLLLAIPSK